MAAAWEPRIAQVAAGQFEKDLEALLNILTETERIKADIDWQTINTEWKRYLEAAGDDWRSAFIPVLQGLMVDQGERLNVEFGMEFDVRNLYTEEFLIDYLMPFAESVRDTTGDGLNELLTQAMQEGWSIPRTQRGLRLMFDQWIGGDARDICQRENLTPEQQWFCQRRTPYRTELIARTESIRSSSRGSVALYEAWNIEGKQWWAQIDERTCVFCAEMHEKIIGVSEAFFPQGGRMNVQVGDRTATLKFDYEEVTSSPLHPGCRCTILPWSQRWEQLMPEEPVPVSERPRFETSAEALDWLHKKGVKVAYESIDAIIEARWANYRDSASFARAIEQELEKLRAEVRRSIPRDLIIGWRTQGLTTEQIRLQIDQWAIQQLAERRPQVVRDEERLFRQNWIHRFADKDVVITDDDELKAISNGLLVAYQAGRVGAGATYIIRNPIDGREQWMSGQHLHGLIEVYNQEYVGLGIIDDMGQTISTSAVYRKRSIQEYTPNVPLSYDNYYDGVFTHEYGHFMAEADDTIEDRAAQAIKELGKDIVTEAISEYAWHNETEAAAEAYALYRHPDFAELPDRSQRVVRFILFGEGHID